MLMKQLFLNLVKGMFAGVCLLMAGCSDDDPEITPEFPETFTQTVASGKTCTFEITPNMDWVVSVPTETAEWFWIQDGEQRVYSVRGLADAKTSITICTSDVPEYYDTHTCEVSLTMNNRTEIVARITIELSTLVFNVYTAELDGNGDFQYSTPQTDTDPMYIYGSEPQSSVELTWPDGKGTFMQFMRIESNVDWGIKGWPEWLQALTTTEYEAGKTNDIKLWADLSKLPAQTTTATLTFYDQQKEDATLKSFQVTIPGASTVFTPGFDAEYKFNAAGEYWSSMMNQWVPAEWGMILSKGTIRSGGNAKVYALVEGTSADEVNPSWVTLTMDEWDQSAEAEPIQEQIVEISVTANEGEARTAKILALPASAGVTGADQLLDASTGKLKNDYAKYVVSTISQESASGGEETMLVSIVENTNYGGVALSQITDTSDPYYIEGTSVFRIMITSAMGAYAKFQLPEYVYMAPDMGSAYITLVEDKETYQVSFTLPADLDSIPDGKAVDMFTVYETWMSSPFKIVVEVDVSL